MHVGSRRMTVLRINGGAPIATLACIATVVGLYKPNDHHNLRGNGWDPINQGGVRRFVYLCRNSLLVIFHALPVVARHMWIQFEEDGQNEFWIHEGHLRNHNDATRRKLREGNQVMPMPPKYRSYSLFEIVENCPPNEWQGVQDFLYALTEARGASGSWTYTPVNLNALYCAGKEFPIPPRVREILMELCGPVFNVLK